VTALASFLYFRYTGPVHTNNGKFSNVDEEE